MELKRSGNEEIVFTTYLKLIVAIFNGLVISLRPFEHASRLGKVTSYV